MPETVVFGDVTFTINKLPPKEAKRLFLGHVRPLFLGLTKGDLKEDCHDAQMLAALIAGAPQEHIDAIIAALYKRIEFEKPNVPKCRLLGREDTAFEDLDMAHSLILDSKAFFSTFGGSWDVIKSEWPEAADLVSRVIVASSTPSLGT